MAQRALIDLKKLSKDLGKIQKSIEQRENIATVRTINIAAKEAKTMIARDLNEDHGIAIGTAKRRIEIYKATRNNYQAALYMKDTRVTFPQPRKIKMGVSYLTHFKKRVRVTTHQRGGSRPFIIKGQYSGKKLPVYVIAEDVRNKKAAERHVQAMYFSSIPKLARDDWQKKVMKHSLAVIRREYPKQLQKAKYTGRF